MTKYPGIDLPPEAAAGLMACAPELYTRALLDLSVTVVIELQDAGVIYYADPHDNYHFDLDRLADWYLGYLVMRST